MLEIIHIFSIIFELNETTYSVFWTFGNITLTLKFLLKYSIFKTFIGNRSVYYENFTKLTPSPAYCNFSKNADWIE